MADQAERVVLEADDQVTPITSKANASLENFERKATNSGEKIVRINDQIRQCGVILKRLREKLRRSECRRA